MKKKPNPAPVKNQKLTLIAMSVLIVLLAGVLIGVLVFMKNQPIETRGVPTIVAVAPLEPDSSQWGINYPNQYTTLLQTEFNNTRTTYGGSEPFSKLEEDPRLLQLFAGYSFSKEYNEERGHWNALTDVRATDRLSDKTPGTCYSCKSSNNPQLWAEMGMQAYDEMPFAQLGEQITEPIGCANCHEAGTMRLVVTNPALETALVAQGLDWQTFTRQEMRTIVCANCHVEYYFDGPSNLLTFPWTNGTTIEDIEAYYAEDGHVDWTHPVSGTEMIKMQHPDYELFSAGSTHYEAGVACADCHMPYTRDGAVKFSTHDVHSPLFNPASTCGTCHTDVDYVVGRVEEIQNQVHQTMIAAEDAIVAAINTISAAAATDGVDAEKLAEARQLHRLAQLRWDFIAAENSMGFHNPEETLRILATSIDYARQAQILAMEAMGK
ncbi:MAG TPA: ammonia-forming cytochrome c nitrite reductase subunit c552 [Anaerolineaceae bacterium]|nr:ammonia-forming cytochrome c nitrite reductase subunit c552 [Anaerolineaceae bacterium]